MSTEVSEEDLAALKSHAQTRKLTLSEWVGAELLEPKTGGCKAGETNGKPVTSETMQELIARTSLKPESILIASAEPLKTTKCRDGDI